RRGVLQMSARRERQRPTKPCATMCGPWTWKSPVLAATPLVAGDGRNFVENASILKCRFALDAIARRYVDARRLSQRLGIGISALGISGVRWQRVRLAGVHVNPEEHLMTKVSKTLIATAAFAVIATSAFSEAAWDLKAGMAYVYG